MNNSNFTKARKINAIIFAVLSIAMGVFEYLSWCDYGIDASLFVMILAVSGGIAIFGYCVDFAIRDIENQNKIDKYDYR